MPDFMGAFYFYRQEVLQARDGRDVSVELSEVGDLVLTSGRIVACDGLIPSTEPFLETVEPGSYPVILSVAQTGSERPVIACAMLRFKDEMPTVWKLAADANHDEVTGYGVDSGRGCFADFDAMQTLTNSPGIYDRLWARTSHPLVRSPERAGQPVVDWFNFYLDVAAPSNMIIFESGYGDGTYPSYFGYDADGSVVCLATDFGVLAPLPGGQWETPNKYQLGLDF